MKNENLHEGRDLAVTTDFRDVFGEIAAKHLHSKNTTEIFPRYFLNPSKYKGILS